LRGLRIVASRQPQLDLDDHTATARWDTLPEPTQVSVLALLARLIVKGVLSGEESGDE
jgi:hypothetical protein